MRSRACSRRARPGRVRIARALAFAHVLLAAPIACEAAVCVPSFTTMPAFDVGSNRGTNALADLDKDGNLDLLTGTAYFLGDGRGGFGERTPLQGVPLGIFDVIAGDLDHDGRLDLILGIDVGITVFVLFGREPEGDAGYLFDEPIDVLSIEGPWHLAPIDIDEDGFLDFAAAGTGGPSVAVCRNNGDRTFQPFVRLPTSPLFTPYALAVGDFDGDGHQDIGTAGFFNATLWFGDGTGEFRQTAVADLATPEGSVIAAHRLCAADLDGDGRSEIVGVGVAREPESVGFLFGYRGGSIDPARGLPARTSFSYRLPGGGRFLQVADVNRDGMLDIVTQGERLENGHNFIQIFYGFEEDGYALEPAPDFETALSGHGSVLAVADVDNDESPDIVLTTEDTDLGEVSLNDGRCAPDEAARGDVNADGRLDIADAIAVLSYLFAQGSLACLPAADANSSDGIDLADAIFILQHLFASGPPPAAGSVVCGDPA